MTKLIFALFVGLLVIFLIFKSGHAQQANAGPDQTIYLTKSHSAVLDGSRSNGDYYKWTDISATIGYPFLGEGEGHPKNSATITSVISKKTTVNGLTQGVWYYQLSVTKGVSTQYDTCVVRVDYDTPPVGSNLFRKLPINDDKVVDTINSRYDTTNYIDNVVKSREGYYIFTNRARLPDEYIDILRGKFYSVIEDGYEWNNKGYARSEIHLSTDWNNGKGIDSNKTYCFEWKGYFPQGFDNFKENQTAVAIMQIHANDGNSPPLSFHIINGHDGNNRRIGRSGVKAIYFTVVNPMMPALFYYIADLSDFVNKTHTIRLTLREGKGYPGQDAFVKVEIDGIEKYFQNTGDIGRTWQKDYPKIASLYDYNNALIDASNKTRGRKFALVTEHFYIYTISDK